MSEVVELNDSIELLTKKLNEAEDCRAQLVKARYFSCSVTVVALRRWAE